MTPDDTRSARQWALRALGRRMHTAREIREGLSRRGFDEGVSEKVVGDLAAQGYIDDLSFARVWVSSRSVHQLHGRLRILRDLKQKGVPGEMAESVLDELLPEERELDIAVKAALKKGRSLTVTGVKGKQALYRHLRSRGFTVRVISLAMAGFSFEEDPS